MAPYFNNSADTKIRIMCALSYMSMGMIGLLYILLNGKNNESNFFRFHFMQSLLLGIFAILFSWCASGLSGFIGGFLGLFGAALAGVAGMIGFGIHLIMQLLAVILLIGDVWGIVQSLRGKYADLPVVSKIVRNNLR